MKKSLPITLVTLLTVSALTGCAGRDSSSGQNNAATQNNAVVQSSDSAGSQTAISTNETSSLTVSHDASAAYEKLTAYKTGNYGRQSIADFNATLAPTPDELTGFLAAMADVISTISSDDENYDFFTTTMTFSSNELYCEHMGEELALYISLAKKSRPCDYADEDGETVYDFTCFVDGTAAYSIDNPELVTVAERDKALLTFREEMQNYLDGLSEAEITGGDIKKMLTDKSAELANSLSNENMTVSPCEIYLIELNGSKSYCFFQQRGGRYPI